MSRTVNSERFLDDTAKEVLRKQLWQIANFYGVNVLTYARMSNYFHVLVRVPLRTEVPDAELLRRYHVLYLKPTKYQTACIESISEQLEKGGPSADTWRKQQLALMGDASQFMKLLKQRFSIWFNRTHGHPRLSKRSWSKKITLPLATVLRCRVRYFSDGAVLGGRAFVAKHLVSYKRLTGRRRRTGVQTLPPITDWGDLVALRGLRKKAFG